MLNRPLHLVCLTLLIAFSNPSSFGAEDPTPSKAPPVQPNMLAPHLGVHFIAGSTTKVILERDGKNYEVDLSTQDVREVPDSAEPITETVGPGQTTQSPSSSTTSQESSPTTQGRRYYRPGDDLLFTLPTGRPIEKHTLSINFTHRFPYEAAFTGPARGATILGLDDFAVPSFGLQYGVTGRFSVSAYRSPTIIGRPIELGAKYRLLDERREIVNLTGRFSIDGQDDFSRNFTTNFEVIASRSIGHRVQLYAVPTYSLHNRPVLAAQTSLIAPPSYQPCSQSFANDVPLSLRVHPCADTFSVGVGLAVDVRPTIALVGEIIPTAVNGEELGIHRLPFSFGIQKKIYHHAFTFGFTTAPGTTTSQRIATRSIFLRDPHADIPSGMFVGFDIMRQIP